MLNQFEETHHKIVAISLLDTLLLLSLPSRHSPSLLMLSPSLKTSLNFILISFFLGEERDRHYIPTGHHHPPTHINFSDTSRGPTTKCHTFLETSHDPWLISELKWHSWLHLSAWDPNPRWRTSVFLTWFLKSNLYEIWNIASSHFWLILTNSRPVYHSQIQLQDRGQVLSWQGSWYPISMQF